ncbi:alkyl sulfatase dimerization domain-containing protein [Alloalcanivorax mobilis]|uniref:alkyl sulfatase dimerization domain-containing protein n=1 Tax=Alloalcanivorax mobilis TaxID=2019569 RepID=UPI000B5B1C0C|nr:alkyl sulfatase dimerization domain-containing protein [Alloalcanivorax mobilis]ASK35670.1 MBL fold metallo-hydrolase [Alcanivorax sp. N3-2A]
MINHELRAIGDACWDRFDFGRDWNHHISGSQVIPINDRLAYIASRGVVGNVTLVRTDDGLVVIDCGSRNTAKNIHRAIRAWSDQPIHTVIYTHGHLDHAFGTPLFDQEAEAAGLPKPEVIGQANIERRFRRYRASAGWNANINGRQFKVAGFTWPDEYRYPDTFYEEEMTLEKGGRRLELYHGMGETDDHTWTWIAEDKTVVTGDFVIWAAPNAGNPQKVQRFARPWAEALRAMAAKKPEVLVPGHGPAVFGAERVATLLDDTATFLETIHDQTLEAMNEGLKLADIVDKVTLPEGLLEKPYLQPTYDDPEFLVRNVWRLYGGWYDGNPAHLKPAHPQALGTAIAAIAGGADGLAEAASQWLEKGDLRLAGHLSEFAVQAEPDHKEAHRVRARVNQARAKAETSLMAKGIFSDAANVSLRELGDDGEGGYPGSRVGIG